MKFLEMHKNRTLGKSGDLGTTSHFRNYTNSALHRGVLVHCLWVTVVGSFLLLFVVLGACLIRFLSRCIQLARAAESTFVSLLHPHSSFAYFLADISQ